MCIGVNPYSLAPPDGYVGFPQPKKYEPVGNGADVALSPEEAEVLAQRRRVAERAKLAAGTGAEPNQAERDRLQTGLNNQAQNIAVKAGAKPVGDSVPERHEEFVGAAGQANDADAFRNAIAASLNPTTFSAATKTKAAGAAQRPNAQTQYTNSKAAAGSGRVVD